MYCRNCGVSLQGNEIYCPNCSCKLVDSEPASQTYYQPQPVRNNFVQQSEAQASLANSILVWGILAVAFAELGLLGVIFACVANSKLNNYIQLYGAPTGKARVGKYLARGALIGGIVMTVFWILYILFWVVYVIGIAALLDTSSYYYY